MLIVSGKAITEDRSDLGITVEVLAAAAGIRADMLRAHEDGSRILSEGAQREIVLAVHSLAVLQQLNPGLDVSDAAFVSDLLGQLYRGELSGYSRLPEEWAATRRRIEEAGEAAG